MLGPAPRRRLFSAAGAPTTRRAPTRLGALVGAEHRAGATARLAQLPGDATPRQARGRAGGEAAAALAPNCCFETAADGQTSGLSPALPDRLHLPFPFPHGSHLTTSARPSTWSESPDPLPAVSPSLAGPFCPLDRQGAGRAAQDPAPRDSKDPVRRAPPRVRRAEL